MAGDLLPAPVSVGDVAGTAEVGVAAGVAMKGWEATPVGEPKFKLLD